MATESSRSWSSSSGRSLNKRSCCTNTPSSLSSNPEVTSRVGSGGSKVANFKKYSLLADAEITTIPTPRSCDTRSSRASGSEYGNVARISGVKLLCWSNTKNTFSFSRLHRSPSCGKKLLHTASSAATISVNRETLPMNCLHKFSTSGSSANAMAIVRRKYREAFIGEFAKEAQLAQSCSYTTRQSDRAPISRTASYNRCDLPTPCGPWM